MIHDVERLEPELRQVLFVVRHVAEKGTGSAIGAMKEVMRGLIQLLIGMVMRFTSTMEMAELYNISRDCAPLAALCRRRSSRVAARIIPYPALLIPYPLSCHFICAN